MKKFTKRITTVTFLLAVLLVVNVTQASAARFGVLNDGDIFANQNNGSMQPLSYHASTCNPICSKLTLPNGYQAGVPTLVELELRFPNRKWSESLTKRKRVHRRWKYFYGKKRLTTKSDLRAGWGRGKNLTLKGRTVNMRPNQKRTIRFWLTLPECVSPPDPESVKAEMLKLNITQDPGWVCTPAEISVHFHTNTIRSRTLRIGGKKRWWEHSTSGGLTQLGAWIYPAPPPATAATGPTG